MDASMDAAADARMDATTDAQTDARAEAGSDAGTDASDRDATASADASTDATADSASPPRDLDYCMEIPRLVRAPVIDGVLEPGLLPRAITPVGWTAATDPIPSSHASSYAIGWQPDGVYFYVRVIDAERLPAPPGDHTWMGDGVELFVDSDGLFPGAPAYDLDAIQYCVAAPADDVTPVARAEGYRDAVLVGDWSAGNFKAFPTRDGYVIEAVIQASDIMLPSWTLSSGGRVGVDLSVDVSFDAVPPDTDAGDPFLRLGQYFLRVSDQPDTCVGAPFCQPLAFCTPLLLD